jgi:hypothetical protein
MQSRRTDGRSIKLHFRLTTELWHPNPFLSSSVTTCTLVSSSVPLQTVTARVVLNYGRRLTLIYTTLLSYRHTHHGNYQQPSCPDTYSLSEPFSNTCTTIFQWEVAGWSLTNLWEITNKQYVMFPDLLFEPQDLMLHFRLSTNTGLILFKISAFDYISYCLLQGVTSPVIMA